MDQGFGRVCDMAPNKMSWRIIFFIHFSAARGILHDMVEMSRLAAGIFAVPRSAGHVGELIFPAALFEAVQERLDIAAAPACQAVATFVALRSLHQAWPGSPEAQALAASPLAQGGCRSRTCL